MPYITAGRRPSLILAAAALLALLAATALVVLLAPASASAAPGGPRLQQLRQKQMVQHRRLLRAKRRARAACVRRTGRDCRRHRSHVRHVRARLSAVRAAADRLAAPVLTVSGKTITWSRIADVNRYVLVTSVRGGATSYRLITGIRITPAAVPGRTVAYNLRTDVAGSTWGREKLITYPSGTSPAPPAPAPAPIPSSPPAGFEAGIVSGSDVVNEARATGRVGARLVRVEFGIRRPATDLRAAVTAHAANGTRVLLMAGFQGTMPTVADARNLGDWAREFGPGGSFWAARPDGHLAVRQIEFGSETSYSWQYNDTWADASYSARAREYAQRFRDAQIAVQAANAQVGMLAQGEDGGSGSANWVDNMFAAVPDLASRVAGWTIHPYGPRSRWQPRIDRLVNQTAARGAASTIPIWATEYGISTDDGRCLTDNYYWDRCMTYAAAAASLTQSVADMRAAYPSRLRAVVLYQAHDQRHPAVTSDREHYFGALHADLSDKGAYSAAVRSLLAAS